MNLELSDIMKQDGRMIEWANRVEYNKGTLTKMDAEDQEIAQVVDAWSKKIGKTGYDEHHELSALITKSITAEDVAAPYELIDRLFDTTTIGEFDDYRETKQPKNTYKAYEAIPGGNVDRSFVDHSVLTPKYTTLQVETDISFQDLRRNGYKSVASAITGIREVLELKKIASFISALNEGIANGAENYFAATASLPAEADMDKIALYLHDMSDGSMPFVFAQNKYIQAVSDLTKAQKFATDKEKNMFNSNGFMATYSGLDLFGLSGQKKMADGTFAVPSGYIFGAAGKIGTAITRGETLVFQESDINSQKTHIIVTGFTFGRIIHSIENAAKITLS